MKNFKRGIKLILVFFFSFFYFSFSDNLKDVDVIPKGSVSQPFSNLEIVFNNEIKQETFTESDIVFTGPSGQITPGAINKISATNYEIVFSGTGTGVYSLLLGPDIQDINNSSMAGQYKLYLFSANSTIEENNTTYDNWNILVYNCTLTVNGQHSFTNLKLLYNSTLTHSPTTSEKEYQLRIEITENLIIDSSSKIDVSNRGYKIGYTKGNTTQGGATGRSGGSYGGLGYGDGTNAVYGNYKDPQYPGSGGGTNWPNGGSGGGLIRINAGRIKIDGSIKADGGNGGDSADPAGSGGGILINTGILEGSGSISANGGNGYVNGGGGGGGRIAIYY
jgi:hypothetical protein